MALGQILTSRIFWVLIACAAAVSASFLLPFAPEPKSSTTASVGQTVHVQTVQISKQQECRIPVWYSGDVTARRKTPTGFPQGGMVVSVNVDEGDHVNAGDEIAKQNNRQLSARIKQLQAERRSVEAQLAELTKGPRQEAIRGAIANVDDLRQQEKRAQLDLQRYERLFPQGAISKQEFDQALYQLKTVKARVESARARLDELQVGTRIEKLDAARASLASVDASIELAEHNLDDTVLEAPFSGTVTQRMVDEGSVVDSGQPIIRLIESDFLEMHVGLPVAIASTLEPNQSFKVEINGIDVDAIVKTKLLTLDPATRTQKVILELADASQKGIVDSQMGRVQFERISKTPGFRIPVEAIVNDQQGLWSCYSVETRDGQTVARRQSVEVLHFQGDFVFVRGTLTDGQTLIVDGLQRITNGQTVTVVDDSEGEGGR